MATTPTIEHFKSSLSSQRQPQATTTPPVQLESDGDDAVVQDSSLLQENQELNQTSEPGVSDYAH